MSSASAPRAASAVSAAPRRCARLDRENRARNRRANSAYSVAVLDDEQALHDAARTGSRAAPSSSARNSRTVTDLAKPPLARLDLERAVVATQRGGDQAEPALEARRATRSAVSGSGLVSRTRTRTNSSPVGSSATATSTATRAGAGPAAGRGHGVAHQVL